MMSSFSSKQRFHLLASLLHAVKNSVTIKEIYSCMANMKKLINKHNHQIQQNEKRPEKSPEYGKKVHRNDIQRILKRIEQPPEIFSFESIP